MHEQPDFTAPGRAASDGTRIMAVANIKGGVGKTTTAVNLAYLCAAGGRATLLWDLDPQGAATYMLQCAPRQHAAPKPLLGGKRHLPELILPTVHPGLDLLPSDFSDRKLDLELNEKKHPTERLLKMSRPLRDVYSALIMDCPPGMSLLSENVLRAADAVIVPLQPAPLSVRMLTQLRDFLAAAGWEDLRLLPFFSMVDRRRSLHQDIIARAREQFPGLLCTEVPYRSEIERMSVTRTPLPASSPAGAATRIYAALWAEISATLGDESMRGGAQRAIASSSDSHHDLSAAATSFSS